MQRIQPIQVTEAPAKSRQLLEGVQRTMGMVPNLMKTLAQSPAALAGYLNLNQALDGALTGPLREQIAVAVAGVNECSYCAFGTLCHWREGRRWCRRIGRQFAR